METVYYRKSFRIGLPVIRFDDVTKQGEIEGLTFDEETGYLLLLYNRGARIVPGMPKGFYEGYDREISEVFSYKMSDR